MNRYTEITTLAEEIRESYRKVVWKYTIHEECVKMLENKEKIIKISQIVLNAVSATGLVAYLIKNQSWIPLLSTVLTTIALSLDIYSLSYDIKKDIESHATLVNKLWNIGAKYVSLLTDMKNDDSELNATLATRDKLNEKLQKITSRRDELRKELNDAYKEGPRTNSRAYRKAKKLINKCKNKKPSDNEKEVDMFLPRELRWNKELK